MTMWSKLIATGLRRLNTPLIEVCRHLGSRASVASPSTLKIKDEEYRTDDLTNVTPKILEKVGCNLHNSQGHPLELIKRNIAIHFQQYRDKFRTPLFAMFDSFSPVVNVEQNFDCLLTPVDHVSRSSSDTYYINRNTLLRTHTTAHQAELIRSGLDAFLVAGDVYRRDSIDSSHYPVFHQMDGVKLFTQERLFQSVPDPSGLVLFENGRQSDLKQHVHTLEAVRLVEHDLKTTLEALAQQLFGSVKMRWVDACFPFTHPSWELEVYFNDDWLELLGCGVIRQPILSTAGASDQVGWAFGLGLERLAMVLYSIPDIRLFWSQDPGFLSQFKDLQPNDSVTYKPVSVYPPLLNDLSAWVPDCTQPNDFYDLVRSVAGDLVEQVELVDTFRHPKHDRLSHCYRVVYRSMDRTLSQAEVTKLHKSLECAAVEQLQFEIR